MGRLATLFGRRKQRPGEMAASFYDEAFASIPAYHQHYTQSEYYFVWAVIIDRIRQDKAASMLEIGCGPGQLARAIVDAFPTIAYLGFDFSEVAIQIAREHSPQIRFEVADALTTHLLGGEYELALSTEFLEHIEADLQVLAKLRAGVTFIGTVPNFPYVSHVRHFTSAAQVHDRYASMFDPFEVCSYPANAAGKTFYLMQGVKR